MFFILICISIGNQTATTSFQQSNPIKMSNIDIINAYKSTMAMNKQVFKGDVFVNKKGRGEVKWVATPETLDIVFGNLKRSVHSRTPMSELTNLFASIEQNKFATQIKTFTKFYTNPQYSANDINLGSCPQIDKKIPYNIHKQDKEYFVTLILNWYEKYFLWKQKNKKDTKNNKNNAKIHVAENIQPVTKIPSIAIPVVQEAIPVAEGWEELVDGPPDSWEDNSEEGLQIAPESWEDIVEEDI